MGERQIQPPLELGDELQVKLALGGRTSGLETVVYTDQTRGRRDAGADADAVVVLDQRRSPIEGGDPRERDRVIPEERRMLTARAQEPAPLESRQAVAIDAELLLVESAQGRGAAQRIAIVDAQHALG